MDEEEDVLEDLSSQEEEEESEEPDLDPEADDEDDSSTLDVSLGGGEGRGLILLDNLYLCPFLSRPMTPTIFLIVSLTLPGAPPALLGGEGDGGRRGGAGDGERRLLADLKRLLFPP